ncbi:hypothetical protein [Emticicia sp. SJ17W-69]|uniref:hypothetical protein n=1 Tax=Emticicia sp. SJ17W-69 TaxID=3421657 RepID=UPI003EB72C61
MLQRILVIILLMSVEFSTIKEYFSDFKENVEVNDIEDQNESEDFSKEIIDKFFVEKTIFHFSIMEVMIKNTVCDDVISIISNPFKSIDSPPPQILFV